MKKIAKIAVKKPSGKIVSAPPPAHHADLKVQGKRGFLDSNGKFENRTRAAKTAIKAGQVKGVKKVPFLHSTDLEKGMK